MSFREKHLWASVVATVAVWGFYFWTLTARIADGALHRPGFIGATSGLFALCLVLVVATEVGLTLLATVTSGKAERGAQAEREMRAALQASHVAMTVLTLLIVALAVAAYALGLGEQVLLKGPTLAMSQAYGLVLIANILLACVVVSELTRFVFTLALIRRR
jgi:hypothetical protein